MRPPSGPHGSRRTFGPPHHEGWTPVGRKLCVEADGEVGRRRNDNGADAMARFKIEPHFRLQEWVAEEKGYFRDEGLDYEFREFIRSSGGAHHVTSGRSGAFQSIEK